MRNSPDVIREALETAESWLDRWATHVATCPEGNRCSCGLTVVRSEIAQALAAHDASRAGEGEGGAVAVDRCEDDGEPCYITWGDEPHWRCGTSQCSRYKPANRIAALNPSVGPTIDPWRAHPVAVSLAQNRLTKWYKGDDPYIGEFAVRDDVLTVLRALVGDPPQSPSPALDVSGGKGEGLRAFLQNCRHAPPADPTPGDILAYAQMVATAAAKRVGCVPEWRPLPDVLGCLTQIDNALTGLVASPSPVAAPAGWRDIATAPKDGNAVLLWYAGSPDATDFAGLVDHAYWDNDAWVIVSECEHDMSRPPSGYTHWMPLPARPGAVSPPGVDLEGLRPLYDAWKQAYATNEEIASRPDFPSVRDIDDMINVNISDRQWDFTDAAVKAVIVALRPPQPDPSKGGGNG
jgi:hypothetical protein